MEEKEKKKKGYILGDMTYQEYIHSWIWKDKSAYIKKINDYTCNKCKKQFLNGGLDVHHIRYDSIGNENRHDVEVLCRECHQKKHQK